MSALNEFLRNKFLIRQDHDAYKVLANYVVDVIEDLGATTVLLTTGKETLQVPVFESTLEDPAGRSWNVALPASLMTGRFQVAKEPLEEEGTDIENYLLRVAGQTFGNYLKAELLDGQGNIFIRFAGDVEVERYFSADDDYDELASFKVTMYGSAARVLR